MVIERIDKLGTWRYACSMNTLLMTTFIGFFTLVQLFPRFGLLGHLKPVRSWNPCKIVDRKKFAQPAPVAPSVDYKLISNRLGTTPGYPNHLILSLIPRWNTHLTATNMPSLLQDDWRLSIDFSKNTRPAFSNAGRIIFISQEQQPCGRDG